MKRINHTKEEETNTPTYRLPLPRMHVRTHARNATQLKTRHSHDCAVPNAGAVVPPNRLLPDCAVPNALLPNAGALLPNTDVAAAGAEAPKGDGVVAAGAPKMPPVAGADVPKPGVLEAAPNTPPG